MLEVREARENRGGELRQAREEHKGRGTYLNYYDDLGISTTEQGAGAIRKDEQLFQEDIGVKRGILSDSQVRIDKARADVEAAYNAQVKSMDDQYASIPGASEIVNKAWASADNVGVNVINKYNKVEATYYLPRSAVVDLDNSLQNSDNNYATAWYGSSYNIVAWGNADSGGGVLHEELAPAARTYENNFKADAFKEAAKALGVASDSYATANADLAEQYATAKGDLSAAQGEWDVANTEVNRTVSAREDQWELLRGNYQARLNSMKDVLSGLNIEEGGK